MSTPPISVVISVRDRSDYLREALVSLQRQTVPDWECVVVDDHSDEDIAAVVTGMGDARFIFVKNEGAPGISAARNLGNRQARAEWIAVADSDDLYLPRRLELTLAAIAGNPGAGVVYGNMYYLVDGTYDIRPVTGPQAYDRGLLYERNIVPHITSAYRRDLAMERGYDESLESAVDYDLWLSMADRRVPFHYIDEPLALYRRHAGQISTDPERQARQAANARLVRERHPYHG